ncbi:hypothetical protein DICVIV_01859 [Dictyocaulus viviparus]|uniref:Uncharacterized protein n=1 Tax=Dictyocaulus viviparus TaxID=29172 RepID=A0A0D8Y525_DICVI|nr:hypothetical protein DICVIV_01859 [Dictyocaulus viviparus]
MLHRSSYLLHDQNANSCAFGDSVPYPPPQMAHSIRIKPASFTSNEEYETNCTNLDEITNDCENRENVALKQPLVEALRQFSVVPDTAHSKANSKSSLLLKVQCDQPSTSPAELVKTLPRSTTRKVNWKNKSRPVSATSVFGESVHTQSKRKIRLPRRIQKEETIETHVKSPRKKRKPKNKNDAAVGQTPKSDNKLLRNQEDSETIRELIHQAYHFVFFGFKVLDICGHVNEEILSQAISDVLVDGVPLEVLAARLGYSEFYMRNFVRATVVHIRQMCPRLLEDLSE